MFIRDDVRLAAYAVHLGFSIAPHRSETWTERGRNTGTPKETLEFFHGATRVWLTERGWRVATLGADGLYAEPKPGDWFKSLKDALDYASHVIKQGESS